MVVVHIVLFDFSGAAEDKVAACLAALATLRSIPGVSAVSYGATFTQRGKHFTHALTVTLVDKAALEAYAPHPDHVAVLNEHIKPIMKDVLAMDYLA